ncbi:hypothetical protein EDB19DRAFT_459438 [Suillus lakei]|nr:hypothetical protein EDB19DRAFT_459438 [Suillus lakei]
MAILDSFLRRRPKETSASHQQSPPVIYPLHQHPRGTSTAHQQPPPAISLSLPQQELLCKLTPSPQTPSPSTTTSNRQQSFAPGTLQNSPSSESNAGPTLEHILAEELLTQETDADGNHHHHHSYANRSVVRARHSEWDHALEDAVIVRRAPDHDPLDDWLTFLGDIVHRNPALINGLCF